MHDLAVKRGRGGKRGRIGPYLDPPLGFLTHTIYLEKLTCDTHARQLTSSDGCSLVSSMLIPHDLLRTPASKAHTTLNNMTPE